jgi:hypothetical protein
MRKLGLQGTVSGYQTQLITQTNLLRRQKRVPCGKYDECLRRIFRWIQVYRGRLTKVHRAALAEHCGCKPMQYIENSPLFYIQKIETPL